ncbi:hypothetical protein B0H13DRAFT_1868308 [Mycena leptocephala]|nr:hypothetical protein B0H13DRAFT_1868308 [Mycena leptocephala]
MASVGPTPVKCHEPTAMAVACSVKNAHTAVQPVPQTATSKQQPSIDMEAQSTATWSGRRHDHFLGCKKNMRRLIVASGITAFRYGLHSGTYTHLVTATPTSAWPEEANKPHQFDSGTLNFDTKPIVEVMDGHGVWDYQLSKAMNGAERRSGSDAAVAVPRRKRTLQIRAIPQVGKLKKIKRQSHRPRHMNLICSFTNLNASGEERHVLGKSRGKIHRRNNDNEGLVEDIPPASDKQHHASSDLEGTIHALRSLEPPVGKVGASGCGWYTIDMDDDYIEEVDLRGESS